MTTIDPLDVRRKLLDRAEVALLDLREEYEYAKDHPLFAASLPLSRLELDAPARLPRRTVPIVLYDAGEGLVPIAAERLAGLGYTDVRALAGGLHGWRAAGLELFRDVNSASKAFGELVEERRHTPSIAAPDLRARLDRGEDIVVLDARPFDEYRVMSIPGGVSVPGAELVLRAGALAPNPSTTIVVNCAGRTRSLIGAQSLINAGLPNPVQALRNGTIGWTLAGLTLDHDASRRAPLPEAAPDQAAAARTVADRAGVRRLDAAGLARLAADPDRTLYRFDVRDAAEYEAGHLPGFRHAPGGQLVQETDVFAPVRGARIVVFDDRGARADMTASWLAQMAWDVFVLDHVPSSALTDSGGAPTEAPALPDVAEITPADLAQLGKDPLVVDLASSRAYRRGHLPGAAFAIRARLGEAIAALRDARTLVLTSPDGRLARLAASDLEGALPRPPRVLLGGTDAWLAEGRALEAGDGRALVPFEDVYRRPYEGADHLAEAMQAYLDWEYGLVAQLERDATHGFFVI